MSYFRISELAGEFARERCKMIEWQLVRCMEELIGRVPSDEEVAEHMLGVQATYDSSLEEFYWKQTFLFGVKTEFGTQTKCHCYFDKPLIKRDDS